MTHEPTIRERSDPMVLNDADRAAPTVIGTLPPDVAMSERAAAALRAYLLANGLAHYRIFTDGRLDLRDIDEHLEALGESAVWELPAPTVAGGEAMAQLSARTSGARVREAGFLRLDHHQIVLARWYWIDTGGRSTHQVWLCAAPTVDHYHRLHEKVLERRRAGGAAVWQIIRGDSYRDRPTAPRRLDREDQLVLPERLRERVERDIVRFFSDEVVRLYEELGVPHRRGVLLHGPPGNGKTSLIRLIGARLAHVPAMILRPDANFDSDDLQEVIDRWTSQSPAILVVEDLDWLLKAVNVSTFLNLLDGIDRGQDGLLLIATTNHPEELDPAINNRPGRFDVVMEVPRPEAAQRRAFLRRSLPEQPAELLEKLVAQTDRLSFAHLEEVLRLSGLFVIDAGRAERTAEDLLRAVRMVREGHEDAVRGFAAAAEVPFGLQHLRQVRRSEWEQSE